MKFNPLPLILFALFLAGGGYGVYRFTKYSNEYDYRGREVTRLRADSTTYHDWVKTLEGLLSYKNDTLRRQAGLIGELTAEVSTAKAKEQSALVQAYQSELGAAASNRQVSIATARMNALARKNAADREQSGVGVIATSELDSVLNGDVANLKGVLRNYEEEIVPGLSRANGILLTDKAAADARAEQAEGALLQKDGALLEAESVFVGEAQTKRFLGTGRKKAMRKGAEAVRRIRQK